MLTLLSPAKKLLTIEHPYCEETTEPMFKEKTAALIDLMQAMSISDIAKLMHLSKDLAELNYQRYQSMLPGKTTQPTRYPALFLFQGDVYQTLKAAQWNPSTLAFSQEHLGILSGLYGLLKPLDEIMPYRLEMGTKLVNASGKNLYDFWQTTLTVELNERLAAQDNPLLINLASAEYFKAVNTRLLKAPVITIHFLEKKENQLKVIGIHAKRARGLMANYIMTNKIDDLESIKQFNESDYRYCAKSSDKQHLHFIRSH